jgi:hypothetical protein
VAAPSLTTPPITVNCSTQSVMSNFTIEEQFDTEAGTTQRGRRSISPTQQTQATPQSSPAVTGQRDPTYLLTDAAASVANDDTAAAAAAAASSSSSSSSSANDCLHVQHLDQYLCIWIKALFHHPLLQKSPQSINVIDQ